MNSSASNNSDVTKSWIPMVVIALGQFLMSFNVAAIPMSIGPMVETFSTPPTTVATAVVVYSLFVAAFIMLGAKLGQIFGSRLVFQIASVAFGIAMVTMALSPTASIMILAQGIAGATASALVPTLVVLIASNYSGKQQAKALGMLGSAQAFAGVTGFLIAGIFGTWIGWRYAFALLIPVAMIIFILSFKLEKVARRPEVRIDLFGALLAATSIILLSFGFNNMNRWGILLAGPGAPFEIFGASPAPLMIAIGAFAGQAFFAWSYRRKEAGQTPLLDLEVLRSAKERSAVICMFAIVALGSAINFLVPLYIQIVQGRTSLQTGISMMPYNLTIFVTAMLIVRLYDTWAPTKIARWSFILVAAGMAWLAFVIRNDWSTLPVILGLITVGAGQGALVTLFFNVLVTSAPKELAGDVGSLRGTTNNLAGAVGTALAGALAVGLLSSIVMMKLINNPVIPASLKQEVNLDSINFVSNDRLEGALAQTTASPEQVIEAVRINTLSRLTALKISFFVFAGIALLAIFPAGKLPDYVPGAIPKPNQKRDS